MQYFGTGGDVDGKATYVKGKNKPILKQQLEGPLQGSAAAIHRAASSGDYGNGTYQTSAIIKYNKTSRKYGRSSRNDKSCCCTNF